jgi:uncharacterized protein (TIGR02147 family)
MKPLHEYIDYRRFLGDWFAFNKERYSYFSYRYFSSRAGIKSPVFLKLVVDGKRNLTPAAIEKFCTALKLGEKESTYFRNLVLFNQATTARDKQQYYLVLKSMAGTVHQETVGAALYDYYDTWYASVIRELACLHDFGDDYAGLARHVHPRITPRQARDAVAQLVTLGLIKRRSAGGYEQTKTDLTTGAEVSSLAIRNFNRTMIRLAGESLDGVSPSERHTSGVTMGVSQPCYEMIVAEIAAFEDRVIAMANADKGSDRVYQLSVQLFPTSKKVEAPNDTPT